LGSALLSAATPTKAHQWPGKFIVFEGLDGAGTSTQLAQLQGWLLDHNRPAEATREPSEGPFGAMIRQAVMGRLALDAVSLALAFASDRADHLFNDHHGIIAKIDAGRWVLCDRFVLSSLAYQHNKKVPLDWLVSINAFIPTPDLTIFVDTSPEVCIQRIERRDSTLELFHNLEELQRVRRNYGKVLPKAEFTGQLIVVRGDGTPEEVFEDINNQFADWLMETSDTDAVGGTSA
jgi:dTMP kinase